MVSPQFQMLLLQLMSLGGSNVWKAERELKSCHNGESEGLGEEKQALQTWRSSSEAGAASSSASVRGIVFSSHDLKCA